MVLQEPVQVIKRLFVDSVDIRPILFNHSLWGSIRTVYTGLGKMRLVRLPAPVAYTTVVRQT